MFKDTVSTTNIFTEVFMKDLIILTFLCLSCVCFADIYRVPEDYSLIQEAVSAAQTHDTILIADGTYTGLGNRDIDLQGKGLFIFSENGMDTCVIDCEG